jgi:hypothetical protein
LTPDSFKRHGRFPPPIAVIVAPCDQSCQLDSGVNDLTLPGDKPFVRVHVYIVRRKINSPNWCNCEDRHDGERKEIGMI